MNLAGIDKHDIMFFELIASALNAVGYIAVQMNQNFVEIMVMEIYI
jgi:type IV secretory pathway VirB3-like protein